MADHITPHEPREELVSSVDEAFAEADLSEKLWQDFDREHGLITIQLSGDKYTALEQMAQRQNRPISSLAAEVLDGVLSPLVPSIDSGADGG